MTTITTENLPKRRDKLVIIAEIIDIARNGTSKTHIMFKANLSFSQLNQYLTLLSQTGLLEKKTINEKEIYKATHRGLEFVEKQCQLISFLNEDFHCNNVKTCLPIQPNFFREANHTYNRF